MVPETFTKSFFQCHCSIKNQFLNIKVHTSQVAEVMMSSNVIIYKQKFVQVLIFIPYLDCKILGNCTLKSCLRYCERQAAETVKLNVRNYSKELVFFKTSSIPKFPCKYVLFHYPATPLNYRSFITLVTWVNPGA